MLDQARTFNSSKYMQYYYKYYLEKISSWTDDNLMVLNESKSKYILFNQAQADFNTRLLMNNTKLDQVQEIRLLGVLLTEDLSFDRNTEDICARAFAKISLLTKLKYVGVPQHDLIDVYILFVCSLLEYCCHMLIMTHP